MSDFDGPVNISEFNSRTASANLTIETVSDVLAVFDLYAEVGGDAAVNRAGTNCCVCIRWNDQRYVSVDRAQRDRIRLVELSKRRLEWSIDGRQLRVACKATRGDTSVYRGRFDGTFNAVDID